MTDSDTISRLKPILERIRHWREDAALIKKLAAQAQETRDVSAQSLQQVEETATDIYRQIEEFEVLVKENSDTTPAALAMIAEVGDSLRLVLLEITELGTSMYGARSADILEPQTAG